jgi:hypothetical protein
MDHVLRPLVLVVFGFASAILPAVAQQPRVAQYELKLSELKYDYGVAPPVLPSSRATFLKPTPSMPMATLWKMPESNPLDLIR